MKPEHISSVLLNFFYLANPQNIIRSSAIAERISVQYHCKRRGLQLCILAQGVDTLANGALFGGGATFAFEVLAVVQISPPVEGLLGTPYTSSEAVGTLPYCPFSV